MKHRIAFTGLAALMMSFTGCASSDARRSDAPSATRPPRNTTNAERADEAAADDAERFRAKPQSTSAPARRPPAAPTRRPVDQPRMRP